ncbi:MAG: hypothetical protein Q8K90_00295, partial [Brevundimonas sp.]|nr:hypothetical protein [Brevundimonas sp.]
MNNRLVSIIALAAIGAIAAPVSAAEPPRAVMAADAASDAANRAVVESLYRAFGAGDGATIADFVNHKTRLYEVYQLADPAYT